MKSRSVVSLTTLACAILPRAALAVDLVEQDGDYVATADNYVARINAASGRLALQNTDGHAYTSFDLFAHVPYQAYTPVYKNWSAEGEKLSVEVWDGDTKKYETIELAFDAKSFEINFKVLMSGTATGHNTVTLFKKPEGAGIDLTSISQSFSPQITADGSQSLDKTKAKAFANAISLPIENSRPAFYLVPGPMQFSLKSGVGWMSMSLTHLLDASESVFEPEGTTSAKITMDLPWEKLQAAYGADSEYEIGFVFQFPEDEWDAIRQYSEYLFTSDYTEPPVRAEFQNRPDWWSWTIGCTWGDQVKTEQNNPAVGSPFDVITRDFAEAWADRLSQNLGTTDLAIIIDEGWALGRSAQNITVVDDAFGGPAAMREMIDSMHAKGYKVILWQYYPAWQDLSPAEIQANMQKLLGSGPGEFDADGFKFDFVYQATPPQSQPVDSQRGFGFKKVYHMYREFVEAATAVKPGALLTFSTADPHYASVVPWSRLNDNVIYASHRAIMSALTLPTAAIDGDGWFMDDNPQIWKPFYLRSAANGSPAFYYNQAWNDAIPAPLPQDWTLLANLSRLSRLVPPADVEPTDIATRDMRRFRSDLGTVAQSLDQGQTLVVWPNGETGKVLSLKGEVVNIPLDPRRTVTDVQVENGQSIPFTAANGTLSFTTQPEFVYHITTTFTGEERHDLGCNSLVCTPGWETRGPGAVQAGAGGAAGGSGSAGGPSTGGAGGGTPDGETDTSSSCGCRVPGYTASRPFGLGGLLLLGAGALGLRWRRGRND